MSYLAREHVCFVEMPTEHLGGFTGHRFDLDADLHAFPRRLHWFVVALYARHDAQVQKLNKSRVNTIYNDSS